MKKLGAAILLTLTGCDPAWSVTATTPLGTTDIGCIEAGLRSTGGVVAPIFGGYRIDLPQGRFQVVLRGGTPPTLVVDQHGIGGFADATTVNGIRSGRARILAAVSASCGLPSSAVSETCVRAECE